MVSLAFSGFPWGLRNFSNERHMFLGLKLNNASYAVDQLADLLHTLTRIPIIEKSWDMIGNILWGIFFFVLWDIWEWENGSNKFSRLAFAYLLS